MYFRFNIMAKATQIVQILILEWCFGVVRKQMLQMIIGVSAKIRVQGIKLVCVIENYSIFFLIYIKQYQKT